MATKPMSQLNIDDQEYEVVDAAARDAIAGRLDAQEVTLEAASWSGSAPYTYELTLSGVSSHDNYEIIGFTPTEDDDDNEEIRECLGYITYGITSLNTITFVAVSDVPTIDLPIVIRKV